jgi:hypothetical protein
MKLGIKVSVNPGVKLDVQPSVDSVFLCQIREVHHIISVYWFDIETRRRSLTVLRAPVWQGRGRDREVGPAGVQRPAESQEGLQNALCGAPMVSPVESARGESIWPMLLE